MRADSAYLRSARHIAAQAFAHILRPGDTAVDATMGRGRDSLQMCRLVGETGRVYAFDVQESALLETRALLEAEGMLDRASLHLLGHERMAEVVPPGVRLAAFNLGWLPGGDKRLTTKVETTLKAIATGLALLAPGGLMVICCYPGHREGQRELEAVTAFAGALSPREFTVLLHQFINAGAGTPAAIVIEKQASQAGREETV